MNGDRRSGEASTREWETAKCATYKLERKEETTPKQTAKPRNVRNAVGSRRHWNVTGPIKHEQQIERKREAGSERARWGGNDSVQNRTNRNGQTR
ncbi:hypothetical protein R1flu_004123 [Riccia fluitans]|uniref:Uncharacterized protein n=1 Tax=Riccia fluitans TaxID=41844 RepID=A0ABD1YPD7_9MARC